MTEMNPKSKDTEVSAERCPPPVPQYWINRLITEMSDSEHIEPTLQILQLLGYGPRQIDRAMQWAREGRFDAPQILYLKNHLTPEFCEQVIKDGDSGPSKAGTVIEQLQETLVDTDSDVRIVDILQWRKRKKDMVMKIQSICRQYIDPYFGVSIARFEYPGLFRYRPGGHYEHHADSDAMNPDTGCWYRQQARDYSLVLYLNEDFSGGELDFENYGIRMKPKTGDVVCFPSDFRYLHAAKPVKRGVRYCVVTWLQTTHCRPSGFKSKRRKVYYKVI